MKSIITWILLCLFLAIACWQNGYIMGINNSHKYIDALYREFKEDIIELRGRIIAIETIQRGGKRK